MIGLPDEAIEAFFVGDADDAWQQDDALAGLADEVLLVATGPAPRPSPALRAFLGQPTPASATSAVAATPPPTIPAWKPRTAVDPPATEDRGHNVVPLFRRLRLTAGIAAAAAVAAAALAVAGTTGVLPQPAMRAVSWVVEAVTPFELPQPARTVNSTDHTQPSKPTSTVPADPASGSRAPGQSVIPGPGATTPATPPTSVPAGPPGQVQAPGLGIAPGRQSPAGSSIPLGPLPPAGISPPAGGGSGPPSTKPVDRGPQNPGGSSVPPAAGAAPGRR
ncbi:MAG: hypothetical protein M3011_02500 [Actinomycetota bacterium]|nr:hypothetical protein [Actinomycetota bacterium]